MKVVDVQSAIAVIEDKKHWLYKQASEELETAILTLLAYAKGRQAVENNQTFSIDQLRK